MDAGTLLRRGSLAMLAVIALSVVATDGHAANYRTQNFLIHAPTGELARAVGDAAESYRRELAVHWLGSPIPPWPTPCPVRVIAGANLAAQGVTTYNRAPVRDFQMEVVGTPERILDSVLPHEVTHTVLATHFGRPLPRWADEGICTTVEHHAERSKHEVKLREFLASRRGIAMNRMFLLTEYPDDVLPLYAQGYSVCRFLIEQQGPRAFIDFLGGYMQHPSWTDNVRKHYGYESLAELQQFWLTWVSEGSGPVAKFAKSSTQPDLNPPSQAIAAATAIDPKTSPSQNANPRQTAPPTRASLASNDGESGWYLRRRNGDAVDEPLESVAQNSMGGATRELLATPVPHRDPGISPNATPVPPSVRQGGYYSAAQPQPEQSYSGQATYKISPYSPRGSFDRERLWR